jgi:hypothetical protein
MDEGQAASVADAMRSWIGTLRNLAYREPGSWRDQKIDWAEKVLHSQANHLARIESGLAATTRALEMIEWEPVHDPDTHELLGQLCLWCHRKPHTQDCPRQLALAAAQSEKKSPS